MKPPDFFLLIFELIVHSRPGACLEGLDALRIFKFFTRRYCRVEESEIYYCIQ